MDKIRFTCKYIRLQKQNGLQMAFHVKMPLSAFKTFKGAVHSKTIIPSSFTNHHIIPNMHDFLPCGIK